MQTRVYVDGFNLYYGALRRWQIAPKNNRVVFNIAGNKYRLVVAIDYRRQACFVKFIGTHKQYDTIDAETYDGYSTHKK